MKHDNLLHYFVITLFLITSSCATTPQSPIIEASTSGDSLALQRLIKEGANINEPDAYGVTPLMHAIIYGRLDIAEQLIKAGANVKAKSNINYDALSYAIDYEQYSIINLLLDKGADIEFIDYSLMCKSYHLPIQF